MTAGGALDAVMTALVPWWAAESEICRTYFARPDRPPEVDADWLARQAAKELHDGVAPRLDRVREAVAANAPADTIARETKELHEEAAHLAAFAAAHDVVAEVAGLPILAERDLAELASWPENDALRDIRASQQAVHGLTGEIATTLTEGGCAALFVAGAAMRGDTAVDRAVASACQAVLDDEMEHLGVGLAALTATLEGVDVDLVVRLATEQSIARLRMRQAQLAAPVHPTRFTALLDGASSPADRAAVERRVNGPVRT